MPHVQHEVDVPAEDVREAHGSLIMRAGRRDGLEKRAVDDAANGARAHLDRVLQDIGLERRAIARHLERLRLTQAALESEQLTVVVREMQ